MNLDIILSDDNKRGIVNLKSFIDKADIEGIDSTEIKRADHADGQMGAGDILNSVKTIIEAAEKPLTELVRCLLQYVKNFRTEIRIPTKNGDIVLSHGRSMKPEQLKEIVTAITSSAQ
jgi:hypothetical protein